MEYQEIKTAGMPTVIQKTNEDGSITFIPTDPANSDYQAYLATLAANSATTAQ